MTDTKHRLLACAPKHSKNTKAFESGTFSKAFASAGVWQHPPPAAGRPAAAEKLSSDGLFVSSLTFFALYVTIFRGCLCMDCQKNKGV